MTKSLKLHMDCLFNRHIGVEERFFQTNLEINIFHKRIKHTVRTKFELLAQNVEGPRPKKP